MKLLFRIFLVLVLLLVLLVFGLNWFLEKGLNPAIQKAIPEAEKKLGVDLEVGNASVSLFAGSVAIEGIKVGNPEGFTTPAMFTLARSVQDIDVGRLLFKQEIGIEEVTIQDSNLTVVKNRDGLINVQVLLAALQKAAEEAPPTEEAPPEEEPAPAEKAALPPVLLEQLILTSLLTYIEEKDSGDPFSLSFDLDVGAQGIGTIGEPTDRGTFTVKGNLAGKADLFVINLGGKVAPIKDPLAPTFEIKGKVDSVDIKMFEAFSKEFNLRGGMMGMDLVVNADQGVIDPETSVVNILIAQPEFAQGLDIPAGFSPASLRFPLKLSGTVQNPEYNFMDALKQGIREALLGNEAIKQQVEAAKAQAEAAVGEAREKAEAAVDEAREKAEAAKEEASKQATESIDQLKEGKLPETDPAKALEGLKGGEGKKEGGLGSVLGGLGGKKDEEKAEEPTEPAEEEKKGGVLDKVKLPGF